MDTHRGVGAVTGSGSQQDASASASTSAAPLSTTRARRATSPRAKLIIHPDKQKKKVMLPEPAAPAEAIGPCSDLFADKPTGDEPAKSISPHQSQSPSRQTIPDDDDIEKLAHDAETQNRRADSVINSIQRGEVQNAGLTHAAPMADASLGSPPGRQFRSTCCNSCMLAGRN